MVLDFLNSSLQLKASNCLVSVPMRLKSEFQVMTIDDGREEDVFDVFGSKRASLSLAAEELPDDFLREAGLYVFLHFLGRNIGKRLFLFKGHSSHAINAPTKLIPVV